MFWIARDRLAAAYDMEGAFNHVAVRLAPGASERAVIDALDRLLEPYGGMNAYGRDEQLSHRILDQEINQWKVIGTLIPSIFLAVAAFLLNVVLNRQVATQREQIAALEGARLRQWRDRHALPAAGRRASCSSASRSASASASGGAAR